MQWTFVDKIKRVFPSKVVSSYPLDSGLDSEFHLIILNLKVRVIFELPMNFNWITFTDDFWYLLSVTLIIVRKWSSITQNTKVKDVREDLKFQKGLRLLFPGAAPDLQLLLSSCHKEHKTAANSALVKKGNLLQLHDKHRALEAPTRLIFTFPSVAFFTTIIYGGSCFQSWTAGHWGFLLKFRAHECDNCESEGVMIYSGKGVKVKWLKRKVHIIHTIHYKEERREKEMQKEITCKKRTKWKRNDRDSLRERIPS